MSWALPVKLPSGECHKTSLMICQNGSDFGLVFSGNGPLPEPMPTEIYLDTRPRWVDSVNIQFCAKPLPMLIDIYEARRHSFEGSFHWEVIQVSTPKTSLKLYKISFQSPTIQRVNILLYLFYYYKLDSWFNNRSNYIAVECRVLKLNYLNHSCWFVYYIIYWSEMLIKCTKIAIFFNTIYIVGSDTFYQLEYRRSAVIM